VAVTTGRRPVVVALRALGLGDLCTAVPALRALRGAHPGCSLVLAAPAWQAALAGGAGVDEVVGVGELEPLPRHLRRAEVAVNLHGRGPRSTRLLERLDPDRLLAFRHPDLPATAGSPEWRADEHEVHRWCRMLEGHGVPADPRDLHLPDPGPPPEGTAGAAVVHPGAAAAGRRWPADRFAEVVAALCRDGRQVVLTGSLAEAPLCREVAELAAAEVPGQVRVLAGRTTVVELAALVAAASVVVCNDTGVAHLASAHRTPSVVLFGPTPPSAWGPPGDGPHVALWAGGIGDPHAARTDPGLLRITPADVLGAVTDVAGART